MINVYHVETSILLENTPIVKFIRNYIRNSNGVFSIYWKISISLISILSLRLNLNSLVYDRNTFGSSSKVFDNLLQFPENVRVRSSDLRSNF